MTDFLKRSINFKRTWRLNFKVSMVSFVVLILVFCEACLGEILMSPMISYPDGILMGETGESAHNREFYKFWCIPFGKAGRFEAAEMADSWTGVRDATNCGVRCPQFMPILGLDMMNNMDTTEDCLVLNVFVPKLNHTEIANLKLPVMVWIHGGYFQIGSGLDYSAELFMDEDVVMVTINYRLGPFGFLTTGDGTIEANIGLKDQNLALKWVQKNIKYFGGDPKHVTIFGESAGGGSVSFQVLSPMSKGLFRQAIAQSGTAFSAWSYQSRPEEVFETFVNDVNCTGETIEDEVACVKGLEPDFIREACKKTKWFAELEHPMFPAVEHVPPKNPKSAIFLPDHPKRMYMEGNFNHVPFIQGVNEDEGAYQSGVTLHDSQLSSDVNSKWIEIGGILVGMDTRNITVTNLNKGLRKLRRFYFGDEDLAVNQDHLQKLTDVYSDAWFIAGLRITVTYHSKHAPIYPYFFTKKGGLGVINTLGWFDRPITSHGDDLQYLFFKGLAASEADNVFSTNLLKLWVSFAKTGKPTGTFGSAKVWPPAEHGKGPFKFYNLDDDTRLIDEPFKARADFWDDLGNNEWNELYNEPYSPPPPRAEGFDLGV